MRLNLNITYFIDHLKNPVGVSREDIRAKHETITPRLPVQEAKHAKCKKADAVNKDNGSILESI